MSTYIIGLEFENHERSVSVPSVYVGIRDKQILYSL